MFSIKGLTQRLKVHTSKVAKDLTIKHRRKMFCKYDGTWYQFAANSEVIVPYKQAKEYALGHKKNLLEPININELNYDHLNGKGQEKVPVVVLLGHFNHGKTTLLDSLGGTSYVEEEKHSITQTIRTKLVNTSATKRITIVDTPGQEVFYRMRSYGASIADMALLLVAADDGVCLQTKESMGILEELGIPAIACINKIDLPSVTKDANKLDNLEKELKEYIALEEAPIVRISAKDKTNFPILLDKLESLAFDVVAQKAAPSRLSNIPSRRKAQINSQEDATRLNIVSNGTVLNIFRNRQQGNAMHVIVRSGEVRVGDSFSAGNWCGTVRSLQHTNSNDRSTPVSSGGNNSNASAAPTAVSKPNTKTSTKKSQNTPVVPQVPIADPTVAHAGMAVTVVVTLHPDVKDPRPIGDTIRFHRDASVIRRENKAKGIQEAVPATRAVAPELKLTNAMLLGKVNPNVLIQKKLKDLPRETFDLARDAAAYCMERNQLEMKLASHAVSPSDVMRFGLERLLSKFQKQKPGFRGEKTVPQNRIVDARSNGDSDSDNTDSESDSDNNSNSDGEQDEEQSEEMEENNDEGDDGDYEDGPSAGTVIVKADCDITLGTLIDRYGDEEEAHENAMKDNNNNAGAVVPLNHVLQWGLGEVGMSDVNLASAGDAVIIAYNVGVERSAARQALNMNVKILKFDLLEDAAMAIFNAHKKPNA
eukprot:gene8073-9622_t